MKNKVMLRKFIFLLIVIIIPLLATFFIGVYGYKRYQGEYAYHYMNNIEEVTESKIQGYLKFNTNRIQYIQPMLNMKMKMYFT
jgi:hypothetical protein